jgi:hypothetical protein
MVLNNFVIHAILCNSPILLLLLLVVVVVAVVVVG